MRDIRQERHPLKVVIPAGGLGSRINVEKTGQLAIPGNDQR